MNLIEQLALLLVDNPKNERPPTRFASAGLEVSRTLFLLNLLPSF
jgi:hypothetical protein